MDATTNYAELEIALHRQQADDTYRVELRFTDPDPKNAGETSPGSGTFVPDLDELYDPDDYGQTLSDQLFADAAVREAYVKARTVVDDRELDLRLRLLIGPSAQNLQALRWELLAEPQTKKPFATSERTLFSRFMLSRDWRPIRLRRKAALKALVAVSAPGDWQSLNVAEVPRDGEIERAKAALEGIDVDVLDAPLTLGRLLARLREQDVDVLYLVCHGMIVDRLPHLLLQEDDGKGVWAPGGKLADGIAELRQAPRLAVLASCQSAGTEDGFDASGEATAQSSLAPRLAEAGVPAIVAMQGNVTMETVEKALPVFFRELVKDGQIDRAMAVARGEVSDREDHWMPALYLRLKQGRIWYEPGFAGAEDEFGKWKSICDKAREGKLIPILGPDLGEHVWGGGRELAERLAKKHRFPMARHECDDLAKVTQYLVIDQDREYAQGQVLEHFGGIVVDRHRELDPQALGEAFLDKVVEVHLEDEDDPYRILADLDSEVYVSASAETLLLKALEQRERTPEHLFCHWRSTEKEHPVPPERQHDGPPTRDRPVVYQVFGTFQEWSSLVLTEDEFFDYLIAASKYDLIPEVVTGSLTEGSLVFLGFQLNDWRFRVLFRQIMTLGGSHDLKRRTHVGVQVDPEDQSVADVRRACRYLEKYFSTDRGVGVSEPPIDIYWGSSADFLRELRQRLAEAPAEKEVKVEAAGVGGWF